MTATEPPAGCILLAGRTAAIEWASLLLRKAGFDTRLLEPAGEGVVARAAWDGDHAKAEPFASVDDAVRALDAAAVLIDGDDHEAWPDPSDLTDGSLACPAVAISAFGLGPDAPRGSDLAVSAASGVLHLTGASKDPEGRPALLCDHHSDTICGSYAAIAVLAAVMAGGPGQVVELRKSECFAICAAGEATKWTYSGLVPSRLGSPLFQPTEVMQASDGDVFVLCTSEEHWQRFSEAMGDPEWASWEIFGSRPARGANWDVLEPRIAEWMGAHTRDEVMQVAFDYRLPFALALRPEEVQDLEQELRGSPHVADWLYEVTPAPGSGRPPRLPPTDLRRPLEGVLVLDLSTVWATPLSAQQLAHLGARVIKVETRGRLDHSRARVGELSAIDEGLEDWDRKGSFRETNQGKESVTLNLGTEEGQRLVRELAGKADVIVSNFTPGVAERLGLSTEELWAVNPALVIARLSAYHPRSRLAPLTGFGYAMLLACGFGYQGAVRPWIDRSIAYPDPQAGFLLAFAIVRALHERARSGRGALLEVDLFGPSAAIHRYFDRARRDPARGLDLATPAFSDSLPCRHEEWIAVTCADAAAADRLAAVLRVEPPRRGEDVEAFARRLWEGSRQWEAQQLQEVLRARGVVAQRILDVRQLVREAGLVERGLFRVPEGEVHLHAGSPFVVDGERLDSRRRAPYLGEHTATVLSELLGIDGAELAALAERQVAW